MNFTPMQLNVLKNFATINASQFIYKDKFLCYNVPKSVVALYKTDLDFPEGIDKFAIYNLPEFINIISTFTEPHIEIGEKSLKITSENNKINYILSNEILANQEFPVSKLESVFNVRGDIIFTLTQDKITIINKIIAVMGLEKIYFEFNGKIMRISVEVEKEISMNNYILDIKDITKNTSDNFKIVVPKEDFINLYKEKDYTVKIQKTAEEGATIKFDSGDIQYIVAAKDAEKEY